jgi:hypothetical protein
MRRLVIGVLAASVAVASVAAIAVRTSRADDTAASGALEPALLEWPLAPADQAYARIDGKHLHRYVEEQAAISRRYRDQGHPKFWGRIIGTSADAESADWLARSFKSIGLSDVRIQPLPLDPQWFPQAWAVTVSGGGKTIALDSAQPDYRAAALPPGGLDVEAVYGGLGSAADFAGKDLEGKAVFTYTMLGMHDEGAVKRADERGAAAMFEVDMLPGNMRWPCRSRSARVAAARSDGARQGDAGRRDGAESRDRARLGNLARRDRRDDLYRRAPRRLVRSFRRQCRRRRRDARPRRVLRENSAPAAAPDAGVHRPRRSP